MPWPGINPKISQCTGWCSNNWATHISQGSFYLFNSTLVHIIFMLVNVDMTCIYMCACIYANKIHTKLHCSSLSRLHTITTVREASAVLEIHQEVWRWTQHHMDTNSHVFASSLLLMFNCKHTFLCVIFLYFVHFSSFSLSQDLLGNIPMVKRNLDYKMLLK